MTDFRQASLYLYSSRIIRERPACVIDLDRSPLVSRRIQRVPNSPKMVTNMIDNSDPREKGEDRERGKEDGDDPWMLQHHQFLSLMAGKRSASFKSRENWRNGKRFTLFPPVK
ncbi:hypothetical protein TNCV_2707061 [Trichonephila clavipes]|nr:hypothetical protein TNCV_2707061 [Trichonephila clavipes]